jgi:tRNA 2-selenouridine synthase
VRRVKDYLLKSYKVSEVLKTTSVIIDVRSESEFADAHIPGAVSVPILSDSERAEVGTLYKKSGSEIARSRGLEIVQPKLEGLEKKFRELASLDCELIFCCWRGGERSQRVADFAKGLGLKSAYIEGGHKAFRKMAQEYLDADDYPFQLCTLYGLTGSGKTKMIKQWISEGKPAIDLEGLAHHRGSAFGQMGLSELGRQKDFENNLFWQLWHFVDTGHKMIVVEGESRRIGLCQLPLRFMRAMEEGRQVQVVKPLAERVENILAEYVGVLSEEALHAEALRALTAIRKRLGGELFTELSGLLAGKDYRKFTERLLVEYYDKVYSHVSSMGCIDPKIFPLA